MKGVIFVLADAVRGDTFDKLMSFGMLPNLQRLSERGVLFKNANATSNVTDISITTIMSGLHPLSHGMVLHGWAKKGYVMRGLGLPNLPGLLGPQFETSAIDFEIPGSWHARGYQYFSRGKRAESPAVILRRRASRVIEEQFFNRGRELPGKNALALAAGKLRIPSRVSGGTAKHLLFDTTREAASRITRGLHRPERFFVFVHYWTTHVPYYCSPETLSRVKRKVGLFPERNSLEAEDAEVAVRAYSDSDYGSRLSFWFKLAGMKTLWDVAASYYAAVMEIDGQVGKLIEKVEREGSLDDILFVFTSDHGESLFEHGIYFSHDHGLYEVNTRVPLLITNAGVDPQVAEKALVSHTDVAPTIMGAFNAQGRVKLDGFDLSRPDLDLDLMRARLHVSIETLRERKVAVKGDSLKVIRAVGRGKPTCTLCRRVHGGAEEMYELDSDPGEAVNLSDGGRRPPLEFESTLRAAGFRLQTLESIARVGTGTNA